MIALIVVSVVLLIASAIGIFFVNFALKRHVMDYDFGFEEGSVQWENFCKNKEHKEQWLERVKPEKWTLKSADGLNLVADFFRNSDSHKYVILVHGYTSNKEGMLAYGSYFFDWGFNVLAPDNRAHGESEGKWIGMGWKDSSDHLGWIQMICKKDPLAEITLLGVSMGGATVMMLSGLELPQNVRCLVEDCGYSSVWAEFCGQIKEQFHLPVFPFMHISDVFARLIAGYGLREASSLKRLEKAKVPMLFIHGTADTFVPYAMLEDNIKAYKGPEIETLRVKDATHGASLVFDPELYLETVRRFVFKHFTE